MEKICVWQWGLLSELHGRSLNLVHGGLAGAHGMASTSSESLRESEGGALSGVQGQGPGQGATIIGLRRRRS